MNWSQCELIEVIPAKVSGMPLVKGTRVPADAIVENRDLDASEIAEQFGIPVETVRAVLAFWASRNRAA